MEVCIDITLQVCSDGVPHPYMENPLGNVLKYEAPNPPASYRVVFTALFFFPLGKTLAGKFLGKRKYVVVEVT